MLAGLRDVSEPTGMSVASEANMPQPMAKRLLRLQGLRCERSKAASEAPKPMQREAGQHRRLGKARIKTGIAPMRKAKR